MSKFSTDELVEFIKWIRTDITDSNTSAFDAIIARLRAADKLCEAVKEASESQGWDGNNPDEDRWKELYAKLRKAIADYEGKQ